MQSPLSLSFDMSPVHLAYAAALRGIVPTKMQDSFSYAASGEIDIELLLCIAASNPKGSFYGVLSSDAEVSNARQTATTFNVDNITFVSSPSALPKDLDFYCHDSAAAQLSPAEREDLFTTTESCLAEGGLFCCRYKAYRNPDETLRFLVCEYAPEMKGDQAKEFLTDIENLGPLYFAQHTIAREALEKAIKQGTPEEFFTACTQGETAQSDTFETMSGLLSRGFSFVGDADIAMNYLEMVAPASSHEPLIKCRDQLLYEPIKDFALQRLVRNDIWVRLPAQQSLDPAECFNAFTFGITTPREQIMPKVQTQAGSIALTSILFTRLIDLMSTLPVGIGDFLAHPAGMGMVPSDVVSAIHVLVASGLARPMCGRYPGQTSADMANPKWANSFNTYLNHATISHANVRVASAVVGGPVLLSARDALVLQAVNRVGVSLSAGILQPALAALCEKNPALAMQIMGSTTPTDDTVHKLLSQTLVNNVSRWYAYGLLAA